MDAPIVAIGSVIGVGCALLVAPPRSRRVRAVRGWLDEVGLAGVGTPVIIIVLVSVALVSAGITTALVPIPVLFPIALLMGLAIPVSFLARRRDSRRIVARAAWPDIIDGIRVALRSGSTIGDAIIAVEPLVPSPWTRAWRETTIALRRGADLEFALGRLRDELSDPIADRVIESIVVGREFGGSDLTVVLAELSRTVRRDSTVRRDVRARQSWVRHAARLGVVAPWIVLALLATRPENRDAYSSPGGAALLLVAAGATVIANAVMRGLGTMREPRRWLFGKHRG